MYSSITSGGQVVGADGPALAGGALGPAGDVGGGAVAAHLQVERWSVVTLYLLFTQLQTSSSLSQGGGPLPGLPPGGPLGGSLPSAQAGVESSAQYGLCPGI